MSPLATLLAAGLCAAAETAPVKAVVGQETVLTMDSLPASTSDFAVLNAEKKDGRYLVTVLPLSPGTADFHGRPVAVAEPALPEDADIKDIKPPMKAFPALWPWALLGLLGAAAWHARRRWLARRGLEPRAPLEPALPLEFRIERSLKELEDSGLWEREEHAAYYLRLTEILRSYLEQRWGVPATAMTTAEVTRLVKARATPAAAGTVRPLLERADLVKFARQKPGPAEGPADLEEVRRFVFATSPAGPLIADARGPA